MPPSLKRYILPVFGAFGANVAAELLWYSIPESMMPYNVTDDCACATPAHPTSAAAAISFSFILSPWFYSDRRAKKAGVQRCNYSNR